MKNADHEGCHNTFERNFEAKAQQHSASNLTTKVSIIQNKKDDNDDNDINDINPEIANTSNNNNDNNSGKDKNKRLTCAS